MKTPEGKVKDAVKKILDEYNVWYYMPVQTGYGVTGIPDFICCYKGYFLAIECKAPGKVQNLTHNQQRTLDAIHAHGGATLVVDDEGPVRAFFVFFRLTQTEGR